MAKIAKKAAEAKAGLEHSLKAIEAAEIACLKALTEANVKTSADIEAQDKEAIISIFYRPRKLMTEWLGQINEAEALKAEIEALKAALKAKQA